MEYLLGIDLGEKKTGFATSDKSGLIAFKFCVLVKTVDEVLKYVIKLINTEQFTKVVIGLPTRNSSWKEEIIRFKRNLDTAIDHKIPTIFQEEDFSTHEAKENLSQIYKTLKRKAKKNYDTTDDSESSRIILQRYIDTKSN